MSGTMSSFVLHPCPEDCDTGLRVPLIPVPLLAGFKEMKFALE